MHLVISFDIASPKVNEYFTTYPDLYRNMDFMSIRSMSSETQIMLPKKFIEILNQGQNNFIPISEHFTEVASLVLKQQPLQRFYNLISCYYHIYRYGSQEIEKRLQKLQVS